MSKKISQKKQKNSDYHAKSKSKQKPVDYYAKTKSCSYKELHSSTYFYTKGTSSERNGVVVKSIPEGVQSVEVLNEDLEPINVSREAYFFHENDGEKIVLVTLKNGAFVEFKYDFELKDFVERKSCLFS